MRPQRSRNNDLTSYFNSSEGEGVDDYYHPLNYTFDDTLSESEGGGGGGGGRRSSNNGNGRGWFDALQGFPYKLYNLLQSRDALDIIEWMPSGLSFRVRNSLRFEKEILQKYFNHSNMSSFQRQLNLYGFRRMNKTYEDRGAYYHPLFVRGNEDSVLRLRRVDHGELDYERSLNFDPPSKLVCNNKKRAKTSHLEQTQTQTASSPSSSPSPFTNTVGVVGSASVGASVGVGVVTSFVASFDRAALATMLFDASAVNVADVDCASTSGDSEDSDRLLHECGDDNDNDNESESDKEEDNQRRLTLFRALDSIAASDVSNNNSNNNNITSNNINNCSPEQKRNNKRKA